MLLPPTAHALYAQRTKHLVDDPVSQLLAQADVHDMLQRNFADLQLVFTHHASSEMRA